MINFKWSTAENVKDPTFKKIYWKWNENINFLITAKKNAE